MVRYLLFVVMVFCSLTAHGGEAVKDKMTPQIGSIEDSVRVDPDEFEFSNTEIKLWMDKHLLNIEQPARLHYEFEKTGSYEDGFLDDVYLDVVEINEDNTRNTRLQFFSAERKQNISASNVTNVLGNPVIGAYLQGDIHEMNRLTGGNWKYFLREIKLAMADSNESESITIDFNGEKHQGEKIVLDPFHSHVNKERLKEFSDKRYEFILSDTVPGKLYQVKTVINDVENPDAPLIEEVLTLKSIKFNEKVVGK